MGFRPKLIPTLFTVPALMTLLFLGTWQVERLGWKQALIDKLQVRSAQTPGAIPTGPLNEEDHEFLPIKVKGVYDNAHEFLLVNRSLNGEAGINVVTPLKLDDGTTVLVNRGWVPFEMRDKDLRMDGRLEGEQTVTGLLRFVKPRSTIESWVVPDNEPKNNAWFNIDPQAMAKQAGLESFPDYYILSSDRSERGNMPRGRQWTVDVRNDHLQYAITWYSLALGLLVIYIVYHRKNAAEDKS